MSERDDLFEVDPSEEKKSVGEQEEEFFFEMTDDEPPETEEHETPAAEKPLEDDLLTEDLHSEESLADQPFEDPEMIPQAGSDKGKGGSPQRLLLLLLLVIVLLGIGYFFIGDMLLPPQPEPAVKVEKEQPQKLKVPERKKVQQEQEAVKEVVMPADKVASAPPEQKADPPENITSPAEVPGEKPAETAKQEQEQIPVTEKVPVLVAEEKPATAMDSTAPKEEPAAAKVESKQAKAVLPKGKAPYVLQIGSFVLESNNEQSLKTVKALGFEPQVIEGEKTVTMTRLRVGSYPEPIAREKLREIKQIVPSAFLLHKDDQMDLYAGSYYQLNRARVQADLLFQHEISVDEETVDTSIPIKTIRFGAFPDAKAAGIAAEKAKKAGLEALVIKQN